MKAQTLRRAAPLFAALALTACMTAPAREAPEGRGFLGDYDGFEEVPGRPGAMRWQAEGVEALAYDRVLLDPIEVWHTAREEGVDLAELHALADQFLIEIHRALGDEYPLTREAGPNVLRLRIAITEVAEASAMRKTLRTVSGRGSGTIGYEGGHESALIDIDAMTIEAEALDSLTGERLVALVENRVAPSPERVTDTWRSINGALREWAGLLRKALDESRVR
jgi:hypothetical protein